MSEAKRVSLQSAGPVKKEKKSKPTSPSIRLNLTLPPRDGDTYADFNYKTLILNEKKKEKIKEKDEGKVNGFGPLDPYASDDEDNLKEIARSFESKYGTPKKKYRRLEDYSELGTGYDENDSFIDNTDAFDEAVPEDQTTERGGFYVNKGKLVLKRVDGLSSSDSSDSDTSDSPQKSHKQKLESDSESGSSDSSGDSSNSDDSEDSEDEDENEAAEIDTEESPQNAKENKTNGHADVIVKKPKLSDDVKCAKFSSKKAKNKAITGLFLKKAVREKEHNENRQKLDIEGEAKRVSNVDAAIEAVARGEDSKESGIAESKSHSDLSDSYDSEESQGSLNGSGQPNGLKHPLPDNLPDKLMLLVCALKAKAAENPNISKQEFFNKDVNSLLLRFEKNVRHVPASKRGLIYEHLQCFLPCTKEYLMRKGSGLLQDAVEAAVKEPLSKLKQGINLLMPNAMERYRTVCQRIENQRSVKPLKETSETIKSSPEKTKIPRRRFPWTEELKVLLCSAVRKRRIYFHVTKKNKDDRWDDHLRDFFKKDVIPMWEAGWMKITSLMDIVCKISPDLLQATPNTPEVKLKKSSAPAAGGRKIGGVAKQISYSVTAVGTAASTQPQPPTLSPAPIISQTAPTDPTPTPTPPPPPLSAVSPISSPASSPSLPVCEAEPPMKKSKPNFPSSEQHVQHGDGLLDLSNFESGGKKNYAHSSVQSSVPTSVVHGPNHNSVKGLPLDAIMGNKLSSLSNSVSLTVKPVHCNDTDSATHDLTSKKRNSQGSTVSSSMSSNINNGLEIDVLNLKSQNCSDSLSSPEYSSKKRLAAHHSGSLSVKTIQNNSSKPSFSSQSLETQKTQTSSIIINSGSVNSSQAYSSQQQQLPNSNPIKVSSVAAINLKLSSQAQTQSTQSSSHPMKTPNLPDGSSTNSIKPSVSTFSTPSVISHSMESNSPSLTITPVKPFQQGKVGLLSSCSSSVHNSAPPVSSQASSSSRSERTEVIVTPTSSMPHIKTTSVSSNLQSHRPDSAISYTSSNLNLSNVTVKTHKPNRSQSEVQVMNSRVEKKVFSSPHKSQERDKNYYGSSSLWSSSAPLDSPGAASAPVKTTSSSEKVMVSRKDRILQESRDRGVIDSSMPTLSGPYRSSSAHDTSGNLRPHAMHSHHSKRSSMLPNVSDIDDAAAVDRKDDALQTAQELSTRGTLMSRSNCDVNFSEDGWVPSIKKTAFIKSTSEMSDHRLSGMSGLSMSGLDGIGGMSLGLPPHLVGYQNEYQRHLYGSTSKSGQSDHRPS